MSSAARRGVGGDLAAAAGDELAEGLGLSGHLSRRISTTFTIVVDHSTIVNRVRYW